MITTYTDAVDAMFGLVKTTLDSGAAAIFGYVPDTRWQGVEEASLPELDRAWLHVFQTTVNTRQAGFNNGIARRYSTVGVLSIDIFVPRAEPQPVQRGRDLVELLRRAFEGVRTGGVWYRNVTATESGHTDSFAVYRMMADYEYTEQGR